jgi:hypothetical protein
MISRDAGGVCGAESTVKICYRHKKTALKGQLLLDKIGKATV